MDKKLLFGFVLILSVALFSVFAIAQETEDTTTQDMDTAEIMHTQLGAEVRLLQLEKSVTRNIIYGEHVIDMIDENGYNLDTAPLEAIIDSLKGIKEDISAMIDEGLTETTVEDFVSIKEEAIDLSKQFREFLRDNLTIAQRQEIKDSVDKEDFSDVEAIGAQIKEKAREFNRERTMTMLQNLGVEDQALINRVENGNITVSELKQGVIQKFKEQAQERRQSFLESIKEERQNMLEIRNKVAGKLLGINNEKTIQVRSILDNDSLNYVEKKAKINALIKEELKNRVEILNNGGQE